MTTAAIPPAPVHHGKRVLMKGNEAMAEAAVRAGCDAYFGYPITPQAELLEWMARRMEQALRFRPAVILHDCVWADMQRPHNRVPAFSGAQAPKQFV